MGFGFGPGADLLASYKANKSQVKRRKSHKEISKDYGNNEATGQAQYKEISKEQLQDYSEKLKEAKRKNTMKLLLFSSLTASVIFLFSIFYYSTKRPIMSYHRETL